MSEFSPISSLEKQYTLGKVEKVVEQKILTVSSKITESGIFMKERFKSEQERTDKVDEVVRLASDNVIDSYKDLIDKSCDTSGKYSNEKVFQTFDILKKSFSLAINNDQGLQTSLNVGGLRDILPEATKYDNMGNSKLSLERGIMEVTISNPKIREIYREISDVRDSYDLADPVERKYAADEIVEQRKKLLDLRKEIISDDQRQEWLQAKEYLKMEVGVLDGELKPEDGSANKEDVVAVLGKAAEGLTNVASKIGTAAEGMSQATNNAVDKISGATAEMAQKVVNQVQENQKPVDRVEVPAGKEAQLAYVRKTLEYLETSGRHTRDITLGGVAAELEKLANTKVLEKDVELEVRSRLKLVDCYVFMRKANGYIEAPKNGADMETPTVGAAANAAEGNLHALDKEAIEFFLKNEKTSTGLCVGVAWDAYQYVNINYRHVLNKVGGPELAKDLKSAVDNDPDLGTVDNTYWTDKNVERKKKVDNWIIEKMVKNHGMNKKEAEISWELAKRLALATGENSIFNVAMAGNDEMAEDLFLGVYRRSREAGGRSRGPEITLNDISGIGNSWLRRKAGIEDTQKPCFIKDINFNKIEEGDYVFNFSVWWSGKIHPLRNLLMDREPDPKKIVSVNFMQSAVDYFKKADPDNSKGLRKTWVKGVLDLASSYAELGWTSTDYGRFKRFLCMKDLSTSYGPFITEEEFNQLEAKFGLSKKMGNMELRRVGKDFVEGFFGGLGGGKKKGR